MVGHGHGQPGHDLPNDTGEAKARDPLHLDVTTACVPVWPLDTPPLSVPLPTAALLARRALFLHASDFCALADFDRLCLCAQRREVPSPLTSNRVEVVDHFRSTGDLGAPSSLGSDDFYCLSPERGRLAILTDSSPHLPSLANNGTNPSSPGSSGTESSPLSSIQSSPTLSPTPQPAIHSASFFFHTCRWCRKLHLIVPTRLHGQLQIGDGSLSPSSSTSSLSSSSPHQLSLSDVLQDPLTQASFRFYLLESMAIENLLFIDEVHNLTNPTITLDDKRRLMRRIVDDYVNNKGCRQLSISAEAKELIRQEWAACVRSAKREPNVEIFFDALIEVQVILRCHHLTQFLNSKRYQADVALLDDEANSGTASSPVAALAARMDICTVDDASASSRRQLTSSTSLRSQRKVERVLGELLSHDIDQADEEGNFRKRKSGFEKDPSQRRWREKMNSVTSMEKIKLDAEMSKRKIDLNTAKLEKKKKRKQASKTRFAGILTTKDPGRVDARSAAKLRRERKGIQSTDIGFGDSSKSTSSDSGSMDARFDSVAEHRLRAGI